MPRLNSHPSGRHFLQIPGPTNVPDRVLRAMDHPTIDHRGPEFQALGKEVRALGIFVTAVAPGSFRTDWAGRSMIRTPRSIPDYDPLFDPIRKAREEKSGKQLGDPVKAARAMLSVMDSDNPPAHLLLGSDALGLVREKLSAIGGEIDAWETVSRSTDG